MLSLCMIVKDEEAALARCLDSVKEYVDEIVIVDTGSKDSTKQIAKKYTEKIYDFKWSSDFSAARNFSLSKAYGSWILVLDADEAMDRKSVKSMLELIKNTDNKNKNMPEKNQVYGFRIVQRK